MPAYLFHLAFELHAASADHSQTPVFTPPRDLDIFSSELPVHRHSSWASYIAPLHKTRNESRGGSRRTSPARCLYEQHPSEPEHSAHESRKGSGQLNISDSGGDVAVASSETRPTDCRYSDVTVEGVNMESAERVNRVTHGASAAQLAENGLAVKGKYIPSVPQSTDLGYGVVHLYRDAEPSPSLARDATQSAESSGPSEPITDVGQAYVDKDLATLCILAVPSYMTPSDLLGWVGEDTRDQISHFRLIRTGRSNKYMVLMKFREADQAKQWQRNWNGKLFNSMEPENCHVVFVRSIRFETFEANRDPTNFPDMTNDPFTPTGRAVEGTKANLDSAGKVGNTLTSKPAPPPTPSLLELPTCPVCLERMDETTGLATIFCQHVFHCACLQKWRGSGCPVCRYTQDDLAMKHAEDKKHANECETCGSNQSLWICLICGQTGCGRYEDAHAFEHYEHTTHAFAMDIATQHIWDYTGDEYVHRLIQNKSDGKLVELPSAAHRSGGPQEDLPFDKMENMSLEYTHLLTSQLDSQRTYFEEQVERAVDKASRASAAAEQAAERAVKAYSRLEALEATNGAFANDTVPSLERDKERAERRAQKAEGTARHMTNEWREKSIMNDSLMERIVHLEKQLDEVQLKARDLEEQNRDLSFFISGMEKLKDQGEDVQEGTLTVADAPAGGGGKKKNKKNKQPQT